MLLGIERRQGRSAKMKIYAECWLCHRYMIQGVSVVINAESLLSHSSSSLPEVICGSRSTALSALYLHESGERFLGSFAVLA